MGQIKEEVILYGRKTVIRELVAGTGGNISARDGNIVWIKPTGAAMDEINANDLCGIDLRSSEQITGNGSPSSETLMHLEIYRQRNDINCVLHTHPPWITGIISAGINFKPLMVDFIADMGTIATLPFLMPATHVFAKTVGQAAKTADTLFMVNNGMLATGASVREAFQRSVAAETTAKAVVAASLIGKPRFFKQDEMDEIQAANSSRQQHHHARK